LIPFPSQFRFSPRLREWGVNRGTSQPDFLFETSRSFSSLVRVELVKMAAFTRKGVPMISVPDIAEALRWYTSVGFKEVARFEEDGVVNFGMVSFGNAELMMRVYPWGPDGCYHQGGKPGPHDVSLWFYTDQVDRIYQLIRGRQLENAQTAVAGEPGSSPEIEFVEDVYDSFYGARQFSIRDLYGYTLVFLKDE
jgi:catechol 2,3-dioxygenase-like lactoylglutathione lyase family enzyme